MSSFEFFGFFLTDFFFFNLGFFRTFLWIFLRFLLIKKNIYFRFLRFLEFFIFLDFFGFLVGFFGFFPKLLRLPLKATKVTTEHQKWPKMGKTS